MLSLEQHNAATVAALLFAVVVQMLPGATYYIDWDTGNDSTGDGSSGNRWKTFKKGVDTMASGDTLYVGEGTYAEASWPPSWKDNISIIGEGDAWSTVINPSAEEGNSVFTFGWSSIDFVTVRNIRIRRESTTLGGALKLVSLCFSNTFDNVIFDGANDQHNVLIATASGGQQSGHNIFANCVWTNMVDVDPVGGSPPHGLYITGGHHNTFTNCLFAGSTNDLHDFMVHIYGDPSSTNNIFDACTFIFGKQENGARIMGLFDGGPGTIVRNCVFTSRDFGSYRPSTVNLGDDGIIFVNNTIYHVRNFGTVSASDGVVIANNLFSSNSGSDTTNPFYIESGATNLVFENNYFVNPTNGASGSYYVVQAGAHFSVNTGNRFGAAGADTFNESFGGAASGDFSIGSDSDAIDQGRDTSSTSYGGVTLDKAGNTRGATYDVGAYEYISGGGGDPSTAVKRRGKIPGLGRGRGSWR